MTILCRIFGHKWKGAGHAGMDNNYGEDYAPGYWIYQCVRCGEYCREKEDTKEIGTKQ